MPSTISKSKFFIDIINDNHKNIIIYPLDNNDNAKGSQASLLSICQAHTSVFTELTLICIFPYPSENNMMMR